MTDIVDNNRKISVSFSRKVSDGNYGTIEASAWVQGDAPADMGAADVATLAGDLFMAASVAVFEQLGIEYEFNPEDGVVREKPKATVQSAHNMRDATEMIGKAFPGTTTEPAGGNLRVMNAAEQDGPLPDWLYTATAKDGVTGVWDNRRKAAGTNQPLFKEAVPRGGTGHGKDGQPKGYWAPR